MSGNLAGKVALVTGASSGIGEATALALAAAGASVAVVGRRADRLADLVKRIEARGARGLAIPGDVAEQAFAFSAVEQTIAHFGRVDTLVNSAGITQAGGIEAADLDEYRRVLDVNLMATVYTCKAVLSPMKKQQGGDIINISSLAGRKATKLFNAYTASKHGVNAMTDALRQEVGDLGIRVTILNPGATQTEIAENVNDPKWRDLMREHSAKEGVMMPGDVADAIVMIVSMPRRVNVSEISMRPTGDTSA